MIPYTDLILDQLIGETPKEKYEYLLLLESKYVELLSITTRLDTFHKTIDNLEDDIRLGSIRNFIPTV